VSGSGPVPWTGPCTIPAHGGKETPPLLPPLEYEQVKVKPTFAEFIKWCKEEVSPIKV